MEDHILERPGHGLFLGLENIMSWSSKQTLGAKIGFRHLIVEFGDLIVDF